MYPVLEQEAVADRTLPPMSTMLVGRVPSGEGGCIVLYPFL
jgi:hypothetical protein